MYNNIVVTFLISRTLFNLRKMQGADLLYPYLCFFVHCPHVVMSTSQTLPAAGGLP